MTDAFGLRIGVEGEKEFKDALRGINQSFKVLGSEMNIVAAQFDKNDRSVHALTAQNAILNKEIDAQKSRLSILRAALANAAASFGETDRRTQNWQVQLNNAQAELIRLEREVQNNNKSLDAMGDESAEATRQARDLSGELDRAGDAADEAGSRFGRLGGLLKGAGVAMGAAFVAIGAAATGAAKSLADMTVGASQYADNILSMSTVTGMSTEFLQAYQYAAELVDVSLETLTGSMARNVRSMSAARNGTGETAAAYKLLGISVTDTGGQLRDAGTVYWEAIDALSKVSNETERNALAMQLFGKSAQELNPLMQQGSAGMAKLAEEAKRMGAVMDGDSLVALGAFDDSMQRLTATSSAARNALGMVLLPQLQILADDGVALLGEFTQGLQEANGDWGTITGVIGNAVGGMVDVAMKALPRLIQLGMDIIMSVGRAVVENLPLLVDAVSQIGTVFLQGLVSALPAVITGSLHMVMALVNGLIANLPALAGAAVQMIAALADGIGTALPGLVPAVVEAVVFIGQSLVENLPLLLSAALTLILGLARGMIAAIPQLIEQLPVLITAIVDFIIGSVPLIVDAGIQLFVALVEAMPIIIPAVAAAIPQIVGALSSAVLGSIPVIARAGVRLLVSLIQNLPSIVAEVTRAVPQIVGGIIGALANSVGQMARAGGDLIRGLWQGIADMGALYPF